MVKPRRVVRCPNFAVDEGACSCGCGAGLEDAIVIGLQAIAFYFARRYGCEVQVRVSSGRRCKAKNDATPGSAMFSRHLTGEAADITVWQKVRGGWGQIPNSEVEQVARHSGLFGGVGYAKYAKEKQNLVHLDVRPGGFPPVTW